MNKEDLIKLKKHIASWSEEEQRLRELYLRKIANGELQGPMVGYPSIDMPQLKCYDFSKYFEKTNDETIIDALLRQNADNLDGIALDYFYSKITYKDFFKNIGSLMKSFSFNNVKKGDYVGVCLPGIPEAMTCVYALGALGAVGIYLPPYLDIETMVSDINKQNTKLLIIMDDFYYRFKKVFDEVLERTNICKVVIVPALNSSILGKFKKEKKYDGLFITYNKFIKEGKNVELPKMVKYEKNMPVAVVYSSGTTGTLKGIVLSHDTFNNSAKSYLSFGFDLSKGQIVYQAIPTWASTGLIADGSTALYYGCTLYQDPRFNPSIYSKNLGLKHINWGVSTTELFGGLDDLSKQTLFKYLLKLNILDYRDLKNIYIGGTLSTQKNKDKLDEILKKVGCSSKAKRSYGNCENGSIVTAELNSIQHPDNSVGIPIPGTKVIIIDEECQELPYNTRGEIAVKTNCGMIDYFNRPDLSKKIFFMNEAGTEEYKHTGDIGYILPSGDVIYEGRASDYSIIDGLKIFNFDIKNTILEDETVYDAEVFVSPNGMLCAHIVFYENYAISLDSKLKEIQTRIYNKYGDIRYVPEYFKIRSSFPMASSTKRDFKLLKSETAGFIYIPKSYLTKQYTKR